MQDFRFKVPIAVRFGDIDAMGHVNNALFATYFEVGRAEYFRQVLGVRSFREIDFIMARIEIDFLRPVFLYQEVNLGLGVSRIGSTSFDFEYLLLASGEKAAAGRSIQVFFDYEKGEKKPVPERFKEAVAAFEGEPC